MEGRSIQVEEVQNVLELPASQVLPRQKEPRKEKKKSNVVGCSTEKMEETASKQEFSDTEEMVQWRSINQEGTNHVWKQLSETMQQEVLGKVPSEAYKGTGEPSGWRVVQRVKTYQPRKRGEDCWAKTFLWFREYDLQRKKGMQESRPEKEEMRQQQRMKIMTDMARKNKSRGRMDANNSWWAGPKLL